ncbi:MAG: DJ-1/PfpI family protein [Patescibacteria group bacterium]|nr:DJ-1/PfpI family protein [Patescibacteria group bacterium]MDD5490802.1 DJ-1/PfpI family protein [Patescibacteria group bacterium]
MSNFQKVLLVIAHKDFQLVEYSEAKQVLAAGGIEVVTASDEAGIATSGGGGGQTNVDLTLDEINPPEYDGLFIIGGPGALEHLDNEKSHKLLRDFVADNKAVGAICISTRILAHAGVLKNKKATGWNGDNELGGILSAAGAEYMRAPVVADGNLITATGPRVAAEWGMKILELFK